MSKFYMRSWVFNDETYALFQQTKQAKYRAAGHKDKIKDHLLTKYYTHFIIHFFRKLKFAREMVFQTQKFIHTAVCFFKRFYLANQYGDGQQNQYILCCIYLSLKINQIDQIQIASYAKKWKENPKHRELLNQNCLHFKDSGYSEKEVNFLRGIGFQTGRSPLIPIIETLYFSIQSHIQNKQFLRQFVECVLEKIKLVYTDPQAIFKFNGIRLGIGIILSAIKQKHIESKLKMKAEDMFDPRIKQTLIQNKQTIEKVVDYISRIDKFIHSEWIEQIKQLKNKLIVDKKRVFQIPERKSPKISPMSHSFHEDFDYH